MFVRPKKIILVKRGGEKYETKVAGNSSIKLLVCFILINLILFGLSKTETGAKTAPGVPKLGYIDGRVPKLSSRVTLATPGAGVFCHILSITVF